MPTFLEALLNTVDVASTGSVIRFTDVAQASDAITITSSQPVTYVVAYFLVNRRYATGIKASGAQLKHWTQGDVSKDLLACARYSNGFAVPLVSGENIQLIFSKQGVQTYGAGTFTIMNGPQGIVQYQWNVSDVITPGTYQMHLSINPVGSDPIVTQPIPFIVGA